MLTVCDLRTQRMIETDLYEFQDMDPVPTKIPGSESETSGSGTCW